MGHGGSGCTAVVDAWESHLSLGDAYCSTYGRSGFSYCV